jgi:hypothetical protein
MQLIRFICYALLGYLFYEAFQAFVAAGPSLSHGGSKGSRLLREALNRDRRRMRSGNAAGPGRQVQTEDRDGAQMKHTVGRGVI